MREKWLFDTKNFFITIINYGVVSTVISFLSAIAGFFPGSGKILPDAEMIRLKLETFFPDFDNVVPLTLNPVN